MIELTLEMAERATRAAREKAKALGTPMTITVVDEAGRLVLCSRGDGTGWRSAAIDATTYLGPRPAASASTMAVRSPRIADSRMR